MALLGPLTVVAVTAAVLKIASRAEGLERMKVVTGSYRPAAGSILTAVQCWRRDLTVTIVAHVVTDLIGILGPR